MMCGTRQPGAFRLNRRELEMKKIRILSCVISIICACSSLLQAGGKKDSKVTTDSVYRDEGNRRYNYSFRVSTNSGVAQPFLSNPDLGEYAWREDRVWTIQNPNPNSNLCISSFSVFAASITHNIEQNSDGFIIVPKASNGIPGSLTLYSPATSYFKFEANTSSFTVQITREGQDIKQ